MTNSRHRACLAPVVILCLAAAFDVYAAPVEPIPSLAKALLLDTLKELVSIESGSGDREGLDKLAALIAERLSGVVAERLSGVGGQAELIEPNPARMVDTPKQPDKMVLARFIGCGTKKILLIAHMDTVYLRGMLAQQPFRIDGNRAYGLGIADDKQGIALIIHTLSVLKAMNFRDYGLITVLINGDEEVSSAASRAMLTKLGAEHDAVYSRSKPLASSQIGCL
jgi:glutamate carboxypeptidase